MLLVVERVACGLCPEGFLHGDHRIPSAQHSQEQSHLAPRGRGVHMVHHQDAHSTLRASCASQLFF